MTSPPGDPKRIQRFQVSDPAMLWQVSRLERQVERAYRDLERRAVRQTVRDCAHQLATEAARGRTVIDRIAPAGPRGREDPAIVDHLPEREALLAVIAETRSVRRFILESLDEQYDLEVRGVLRALADQHFRHWMRLAEERDRDRGDIEEPGGASPGSLPDLGG